MKSILLHSFLLLVIISCSSRKNPSQENAVMVNVEKEDQPLFLEDFSQHLQNWVAEFEEPNTSAIKVTDGKLELSTSAGATVWFKKKLSGNIIITYNVLISDSGEKNDRVSDLNAFWMASNPSGEVLMMQNGKFSSYDHLNLYYAGVGGHENTKTRFRKYKGDKGKAVLKEYTDNNHLLVGNKEYFIKIIVKDGRVQYFLDNVLFWDFKDDAPYTEGYFGFRTTRSHQKFDNFKVFSID